MPKERMVPVPVKFLHGLVSMCNDLQETNGHAAWVIKNVIDILKKQGVTEVEVPEMSLWARWAKK